MASVAKSNSPVPCQNAKPGGIGARSGYRGPLALGNVWMICSPVQCAAGCSVLEMHDAPAIIGENNQDKKVVVGTTQKSMEIQSLTIVQGGLPCLRSSS
jgi:hypothetical protein